MRFPISVINIVTLVLSCPVSEILQVSGEERSHPYSTLFSRVPFGLYCHVVASRSEDPKLIIRVITFELTQHIRPRHLNVANGQTDGQMDGRLTIAIRASRSKNAAMKLEVETNYRYKSQKYKNPDLHKWQRIQGSYRSGKTGKSQGI